MLTDEDSHQQQIRRLRPVDPWEDSQQRAKAAFRSGHLDKARELFLESVREAEGFGEADDRFHSALTAAALFFDLTDNLEDAESFFRRGLASLEAQRGPGQEVANYMLSLSEVLRRLSRVDEAQAVENASTSMWPDASYLRRP